MAAGNFVVLNVAKRRIGAEFDLATDDLWIVLLDDSQALTEGFVGGSGDALYADLTGEISGTGYTAGGEQMTGVTWTPAGSEAILSADASTWSTATFTAKYLAIVNKSHSSEPILGFADLETTDPAGRSVAGTDFIVSWPSDIFSLDDV